MGFNDWPLTEADAVPIPEGFELAPDGIVSHSDDVIWWDDRPIAVFASSAGDTWIASQADEDIVSGQDLERWCCARVTGEEAAKIRAGGDASHVAFRQRAIWERELVLVVETHDFAGEAIRAWRVSAERLRGLRCVFMDEEPVRPAEVEQGR